MKQHLQRTEAANDLLTVTVSFVLYMTMLLVLVALQNQGEPATGLPRGWALGHILALLLLIMGAGHLVGARMIDEQRKLRYTLTAAELLSATSLFLLAPNAWVWLIAVFGAIAAWAFCFQMAVLEYMEAPGEDDEGEGRVCPPPGDDETPPAQSGRKP
jgi:hypothetical protein